MSPEFDCRCAVPDWRETIFDTYICLRCGTTAAPCHCYGCSEQVPAEVAHRHGSIKSFHWNDQGGGHICTADAYTDDEQEWGSDAT